MCAYTSSFTERTISSHLLGQVCAHIHLKFKGVRINMQVELLLSTSVELLVQHPLRVLNHSFWIQLVPDILKTYSDITVFAYWLKVTKVNLEIHSSFPNV